MRIVNSLWVWEGRMSEWGEWRADLKVMIWWMAISVVSGELLALAMREVGFQARPPCWLFLDAYGTQAKPPLGPPMTLGNMGNALIFAASGGLSD